MSKLLSSYSVSAIFLFALFCFSGKAHADDMAQFNAQLRGFEIHRVHMIAKLHLDPNFDPYQHASSYYDDMEDYIEQDYLMLDVIGQGIR